MKLQNEIDRLDDIIRNLEVTCDELIKERDCYQAALESIISLRGITIVNSADHAFKMWSIANDALSGKEGK